MQWPASPTSSTMVFFALAAHRGASVRLLAAIVILLSTIKPLQAGL
jgi:hypothetical protein